VRKNQLLILFCRWCLSPSPSLSEKITHHALPHVVSLTWEESLPWCSMFYIYQCRMVSLINSHADCLYFDFRNARPKFTKEIFAYLFMSALLG
jgi:hypothetical protein